MRAKISSVLKPLILGIAVIAGIKLFSGQIQTGTFETVGASEFNEQTKKKNVIILDVRTPGEYKQGHIPASVNIDYYNPDFSSEIGKLDSSKTILVYCQSGNRSAKAGNILSDLGFKKIYNLENGIPAWRNAGYEVIK